MWQFMCYILVYAGKTCRSVLWYAFVYLYINVSMFQGQISPGTTHKGEDGIMDLVFAINQHS